jgi:chromosome segregation ATPase
MKFATAVAVSAIAVNASSVKVSPVQKVIQLLGELKVKVQNDVAAEEKAMDEYTVYCDDEVTEKAHSIDIAKREIESFKAVVEESNGKITEYAATLADSGSEIAAKESELGEATKVRESTNADFKSAESELVDSVDMLARAASVLKRELSFAQGGNKKVSAQLKKAVSALSAVVNAAWANPADVKKVMAFVEEDDLSLAQQPQASTKNYESKSGGIVATIEDMQDKAEEQLQGLRKEEMKSKFDFQMLSQSLNDSITTLKKTVAEATTSKSNAEEAKAKAEEDLSKTEDSKAADEAYKGKMSQECQSKASEWEARQKSAAGEMEAIAKASEILSSGVKAFVQTKTVTKRVSAKAAVKMSDARMELVRVLKKLGRENNSFALMQMANKAASDPFVKIRGLINSMIEKLEKAAQEEATKDAWCKEENSKSKASRDSKQEKVEKYQTRIDKATSTVATLKTEVAELSEQLNEAAASLREATKLRTEENAAYKKASSDFKASAEAVASAMTVLSEFYGSAALIQMKQPSFASANSDSGNGIISFLEVAESDFTRLLAESEADEAEALKAYEELSQAAAVSKATKEAEVKGKTSEIKSLEVAVADSTADLESSSKELDAVMEYIEKLKDQCVSKAMTYEERKAKRDSEVAGLKSALEILAGEEPALSFLQKRN